MKDGGELNCGPGLISPLDATGSGLSRSAMPDGSLSTSAFTPGGVAVPSRKPCPAMADQSGAVAAGIRGIAPSRSYPASFEGAPAAACSANIFGMPPRRPPSTLNGKWLGAGAGSVSWKRPDASGKIGGAKATAVRRLAGIVDQ
jgi:hypothetical protein